MPTPLSMTTSVSPSFAAEWAYRQPFTDDRDRDRDRADALAPWTEHSDTGRIHSSHGLTAAARASPT
jgi:hypothetical protein